ncbi:HERC1 [Symbiodinium sp. CCMP2592]|nr:HERC1 [Symbiodinium sp. CCMP2592]
MWFRRFRWGETTRPEGGGYAKRVALAVAEQQGTPPGGPGVVQASPIVFAPPAPVLQHRMQSPAGAPLVRGHRAARSNSPAAAWAETAQRARLVAKAQADVCVAVTRAATGPNHQSASPRQNYSPRILQQEAPAPVAYKINRQQSFSPRVAQRALQRAASAPPVQDENSPARMQVAASPSAGYRAVKIGAGAGTSKPSPTPRGPGQVGRPPVPGCVSPGKSPVSPGPGSPGGPGTSPGSPGSPGMSPGGLKRASSAGARNIFGMERAPAGRRTPSHTPTASPLQQHRDVAMVKASSTPRLPYRNVREQSPTGQATPRWMCSPRARQEDAV